MWGGGGGGGRPGAPYRNDWYPAVNKSMHVTKVPACKILLKMSLKWDLITRGILSIQVVASQTVQL